MTENFEILKNKKIEELYIPGTHDSACYSMNYNTRSTLYSKLDFLFQLIGPLFCITNKFTQTQSMSIYNQLMLGVRFLDLRICMYDGVYYCSHSYMCGPLENYLYQINKFIDENPGEVIIVGYKPDYPHRNSITDPDDLHRFIRGSLRHVNQNNLDSLKNMSLSNILTGGNIVLWNEFPSMWLDVRNIEGFKVKYNGITDNNYNLGVDCVITPGSETNYLMDSIKLYSVQVNKFIVGNVKQSPKLFCVYSFDYLDKELCDYIISLNLMNK